MRVLINTDLKPESLDRIKGIFPETDFVIAESLEEQLVAAPRTDVIFGLRMSPELLDAASSLRWVQSYSAGINHFPLEELAKRGIQLTNSSGSHAIQIAENTLGLMLAFALRLPIAFANQKDRQWNQTELGTTKFELYGQTLFILGLGGIGGTLALRAKAFGMRVTGLRNRPIDPPPGVDEIYTSDRLLEGLAEADHVVLALPLTAETTNFIGERELSAMKPTAYLYNVGRGRSVNREALFGALRSGAIAGAGLDCTDPEPLPPDDPIWEFSNVILTHHTSGWSPNAESRVVDIFVDNLGRFISGGPLINVIDPVRRY